MEQDFYFFSQDPIAGVDRKTFKFSDLYSCILQNIKSDLKLGLLLSTPSVSQNGSPIAGDMQAMHLDSDKRVGLPLSVFNASPDPAIGLQHHPGSSDEDNNWNSDPVDGLLSLSARTSKNRLAKISRDMHAYGTNVGSVSFPVHSR